MVIRELKWVSWSTIELYKGGSGFNGYGVNKWLQKDTVKWLSVDGGDNWVK